MGLMIFLRNLLFCLIFYPGSVYFVVGGAVSAQFSPRLVRHFCDGWSRFHRRCARVLLGIKLVEIGQRPQEQVLYALKHESFFEAIDLPALLDQPVVFAKKELFDIPGWGRAAKAYGLVPVAREEGAKALRNMLQEARRMMKTGRPLAIFPEGTRVPQGQKPPLQAGFSGIYKMIGLPVVPVALNSAHLYKGFIKRPGVITIQFGAPIEPGLPREEAEARVHAGINALNP